MELKSKEMEDAMEEDQEHEVECLVHAIKQVEMAKAKKPELYQKALSELKGEAKVISSIEDLRAKKKKMEEDDE